MTPPSPASHLTIATPCIGVCTADSSGVCLGCARTLGEIAAWTSLSHSVRNSIMDKLPARRPRPVADSAI